MRTATLALTLPPTRFGVRLVQAVRVAAAQHRRELVEPSEPKGGIYICHIPRNLQV